MFDVTGILSTSRAPLRGHTGPKADDVPVSGDVLCVVRFQVVKPSFAAMVTSCGLIVAIISFM